jgi:hypothetical protein
MRILDEDRDAVVLIELAHLVGLFLSEQQAAVCGSDNAIGVVGTLPCDRPFCTRVNDSRISVTLTSRSCAAATMDPKKTNRATNGAFEFITFYLNK